MYSYSISNISNIVHAKILQQKNDGAIEHILLDSRRIVFPETTLFFALKGPIRNGAVFIADLYGEGVRNFVVDDSSIIDEIVKYPEANFLMVLDVLSALQDLVAFHRNQFKYPVIGITGSNGKTIIKEWLFQTLVAHFNIVRSPKSYNSQIGVPLSVWKMEASHSLGIFEAGISQVGEMKQLQKVINPDIGILGFVGDAHAEGFESMPAKIIEKLLLFSNSKALIYCSDNDLVNSCVTTFFKDKSIQLFSWSKHHDADLKIREVQKKTDSTFLYCTYKGRDFNFSIPFLDEAAVFNAMTCCALLLYLQIDISVMVESMKNLRPIAMRLELKQGNHQCKIINDSYSADIDSLKIALDFLSQQDVHSKKTVIISDILQSGISNEQLYKKIAGLISNKKINRFIGIGTEVSLFQHEFHSIPEKHFYASTTAFLNDFNKQKFNDEIILLKGARVFQFEQISALLEQKIHDTVLEINLNALRNNLKIYRQQLRKEVKLMAMVKAFSYGSGSYEIANLLQQEGVEYLAVAYTDEGVELRKAGIRLPIMVMNATNMSFDNLIQYQLEPEIYSMSILTAFKNYIGQHNITAYPIHLKLDTGMHRLGFEKDEITQLVSKLENQDALFVKSAFSHLVGSDSPIHDDYTAYQGHLFIEMSDRIEQAIGYKFIRHIANTSAIHRHPQFQFDMVRLGIGLYGVDHQLPLQNVTTLKTTISQIKNLKQADTVGYGRAGMLKRDSNVATVRIGYADGYPRALGNGNGKMLLNGQLVPVIGNVCMDMTMLDITEVPAVEGDEVIVFGENLAVSDLANWAATIPYEILTNISQRVKRVYFEE